MTAFDRNVLPIQQIKGHTSDVTSCDFAPNFTLVTGSSDKTVRIWDWQLGLGYVERETSPLRDHKYQVTCVRVSPQGSMLASSSVDGTAVLWNLFSSTKIYTMTQVNGDAIRVCRFSPDSSTLVTAGDNGAICIWDLAHRSLIRTLLNHEGTTQSLAFTPDSKYLVSACSLEIVMVWYVQELLDTTTDDVCNPVAKVDNAMDLGISCIDISKNIKQNEMDPLVKEYTMVSCGNSNEIKIWTIITRITPKHKKTLHKVTINLQNTYLGHSCSVTCVRYNNTGNCLISSGIDKAVKMWDNEGNCLAILEGHNRYVNTVAISKDGSLIASGSTGSSDKQVIIWDVNGNISLDAHLGNKRLSRANSETQPEVQLIRNAEALDNNITLIEKIDDIADGAINSCYFYGSGLLATGSGDKLVRLFNVTEENNNIEEKQCSPLEGHTYAINHVEFSKNGKLLASCSLDGSTIIWDPLTGEKIYSMPTNNLAVKVCRFSSDGSMLITGGDDEKAIIWNSETMEQLVTLEGHLDAITGACFSPDDLIIVTTSFNEDFRLWSATDNFKNIHIQESVHETGILCCDFSPNLDPVPNAVLDKQSYLLATCGNDTVVKLWRISVDKTSNGPQSSLEFSRLEVKQWRTMLGHGGHVTCVRFSPGVGEVLCSTASDRQARVWSVYSAECLFVLDHDSIVTCCSFSFDCTYLATGCLDKTLWLWRLPQEMAFHNEVASKIKCRSKELIDWTTNDVLKWLKEIELTEITEDIKNCAFDGQKLVLLSDDDICNELNLDGTAKDNFKRELRWLKKGNLTNITPKYDDIPFDYLCPITHEIMRDPVICSDGFTYEKNAIAEWFMSGKCTSPMTNEKLTNMEFVSNHELKNTIRSFLEDIDEAE